LGGKTLAKDGLLLGLHAPINLANIGLFANGDTLDNIEPLAAYDPQTIPRSEVDQLDRNHGLLAPFEAINSTAPAWASAFRTRQIDYLKAQGVARIGYYFPPVIDPEERAYFAARCREYDNCIAPTDIEMLAALDQDLWFDKEHLLAEGANIYTSWLAGEIDRRGILRDPEPEQKLAWELRR